MKLPLGGPELLTGAHDVSRFDCGNAALNRFLQRHALENQRNQSARTYVGVRGDARVVGFYTLAAASAEYDSVPARIARGLPHHPVPLALLARLAVDVSEQGEGVGAGLLKDALTRFLRAQAIIGARALVVHAKDESAAGFYRHFGFVESPTDSRHLFLLSKDIQAGLG